MIIVFDSFTLKINKIIVSCLKIKIFKQYIKFTIKMADCKINDILGRFCDNSDILYKYKLLDNLYIALFRINSNDTNYSIMRYHEKDDGAFGGTGTQYCGFFDSDGIRDFSNQIFSYFPNRGLFFFDPDGLNVRKEVIKPNSDLCNRYYLRELNENEESRGKDQRICVYRSDGVLKFVYPAHDVSYLKDEYGNIIHKSNTRNIQETVGEIMLVGRCSVWGFYIPDGNGVSYEKFFSNNNVNERLTELLKEISLKCSVNLIDLNIKHKTIVLVQLILLCFNERSNNNFAFLIKILFYIFNEENPDKIREMMFQPFGDALSLINN